MFEYEVAYDGDGRRHRAGGDDRRPAELGAGAPRARRAARLLADEPALPREARRDRGDAATGEATGTVTRREEDGRFAFVDIEVRLDVGFDPAPRDRDALLAAGGARLLRRRVADRRAALRLERGVKLLLIGGPKFVGHALIEAALARGHEVTTFNRGQTNPDAFPESRSCTATATADLAALEGRTWDAVLDTSGYVPQPSATRPSCSPGPPAGTASSPRSRTTPTTASRASRATRRSSSATSPPTGCSRTTRTTAR